MNNYIFLTNEGITQQNPDDDSDTSDIENVQVIGFVRGNNPDEAFKKLAEDNSYLAETNFDSIYSLELAQKTEPTWFSLYQHYNKTLD